MTETLNASPAIVFDFGGVLLDWNPRHLYGKLFAGNPQALDRFLLEIGFSEWNAQQDKGRPFAEAVADWCERFPHYADLIRAYDARWEEFIAGPIQPTVAILEALKQAGHPLYALSNWSAESFGRIQHKYEFLNWFEVILLSGEVKLSKPDPKIYEVFLDRVNRRASDCLFIDDSPANIAAASELGFQTIWFESPEQLGRELRGRGLLRNNRTALQ